MPASFTFILEGSEKDGGAVFFADFRNFLDDLAQCLRAVELRTGDGQRVRHQVSNLTTGSATVELTAVSPTRAPDAGKRVYDAFKGTVRALQRGEHVDPRFRPEDLKAFRELASPVWKEKRVCIAGVQLTTQYVANIDKLLGGLVQSRGSVKGILEKLNVHNRHEFTLFPAIGDAAIPCVFEEPLFLKVKEAVRRNVTVTS